MGNGEAATRSLLGSWRRRAVGHAVGVWRLFLFFFHFFCFWFFPFPRLWLGWRGGLAIGCEAPARTAAWNSVLRLSYSSPLFCFSRAWPGATAVCVCPPRTEQNMSGSRLFDIERRT